MNYSLYLTFWIAIMITLLTLKCFGIFAGETDFDVTISAERGGKLFPLGVLDGTHSSNSFKVNIKGTPYPGGPTMPVGSISANY